MKKSFESPPREMGERQPESEKVVQQIAERERLLEELIPGHDKTEDIEALRRAVLEVRPDAAIEWLDLSVDIGIQIQEMYQQFTLSEEEGQAYMRALKASQGHDNYKTLAIIWELGELRGAWQRADEMDDAS